MDADLEKEQIGTLFVWWGHWKGGLGGRPPQKVFTYVPSKKKNKQPSVYIVIFMLCQVYLFVNAYRIGFR